MMKLLITLALLLHFSTSFSQWTKVQQLPSSDIFTLYHKDNILYAGGKNIIYISGDKGQTWDSTNSISHFFEVDNIIVYKNELYAACFSIGVYKSADGGRTWQNINAGIIPFVSDFVEWNGDLYAATLGGSVFKSDPANRTHWLAFNNGLSDLSANLNSIAGNNNALVAGTNANGLYDYLPANSTTWEERFLLGQIRPTEGTFDIITAHDSLVLAGTTGRFYMSMDNGLNWNIFGDRLSSSFTSLVNAEQAFLLSTTIFDGVSNNTSFYYTKKDSLQNSFVPFSSVPDNFTYKVDILGNKIWDASTNGLFYMSLSDLPGISAADDPVAIPLPVHFILFNVNCEGSNVLITWKTAQEENSSHFDIQRSPDGIHWTVIGNLPASGNSIIEKSYSFTDNDPVQNGYYRIVENDLDGRLQYTNTLGSSCSAADVFSLWPNPVRDRVFINIVTGNESRATIKLFDSKGALVKVQAATVLPGSNQLSIDLRSLASGVYSLSAEWNNGQTKKAVQVLKQ
jgi:Secretion system C-terminal sorting domain